MKNAITFLLALLICPLTHAAGLRQVLDAAIANSSSLAAARSTEKVAELRVALARTGYLPTVQAEAIDSTGFAGSTGQLGIGGIMGSPYRSGWGYGIVATQPIYDFGKTSRLTAGAKADVEVQKAQTELTKAQVLKGALDLYLECALARTQKENWTEIGQLAALANKEVDRYVKTGQRSVVESLLVRAQTEEAIRSEQSLDTRLKDLRHRLAIVTGWNATQADCDNLSALGTVPVSGGTNINPSVTTAQLAMQAAEARLSEARAGYLPKIVALATVGETQDTRVVKSQNYALGIGLVIPIYDAGKTNTDVERAQAQIQASSHAVKAAQQAADETNAKFQEDIDAASVELQNLTAETRDTERALREARTRYFAMRGNLADLREAIRNSARTKVQVASLQAQLYRSRALQAIYNGGK